MILRFMRDVKTLTSMKMEISLEIETMIHALITIGTHIGVATTTLHSSTQMKCAASVEEVIEMWMVEKGKEKAKVREKEREKEKVVKVERLTIQENVNRLACAMRLTSTAGESVTIALTTTSEMKSPNLNHPCQDFPVKPPVITVLSK